MAAPNLPAWVDCRATAFGRRGAVRPLVAYRSTAGRLSEAPSAYCARADRDLALPTACCARADRDLVPPTACCARGRHTLSYPADNRDTADRGIKLAG